MTKSKEFRTSYWLWALATLGISLQIGLAPMPGKGWPTYPFGALVRMLHGDFAVETVLNGVILPLFVVAISLPFGWIAQAVIVVVWNAVTCKRNSGIANNQGNDGPAAI